MDHISQDRVSFDNTEAAEVIMELLKGSTKQILNWFNICLHCTISYLNRM